MNRGFLKDLSFSAENKHQLRWVVRTVRFIASLLIYLLSSD